MKPRSDGAPALTDETAPPETSRDPAARPPAPLRRRRKSRPVDRVAILLFVLPAFALFVLLVVTPVVLAGYHSLYKWNGFPFAPRVFVGLGNFTRMLEDTVFLGDLRRGAILIVLSLAIQLPAALGLAMLLNQPLRGRSVYRVLFFAPYVLSEVTTAVLFKIIFSSERGLAVRVLGWFGLGDFGATWISNPSTVLYSLFLVISWKYFGFHMILYLAGRQNIPRELTEAAVTDGATAWQTFRHVTLPLLGPTIRVSVFLSVIGAIQLFDMVWVLTKGGPVHSSEVMAVTMYEKGFVRYEIGYASAISIGMFVISLAFGLLYQRFVLRRDLEGALTVMGNQR
jgi:raffinose/stachyose/melibiose transport system permease protein